MNIWLKILIIVLSAVCFKANAGSIDSIVAPGAHLTVAITGLAFAEGPANDGTGAVYFTDQPNNRILRWSSDGTVTTFLSPCGRSNGLCFDSGGELWACADELNELWRIDPDGEHIVVANRYRGKLLNGPNDVWVRPDGGVYITDPYYPRKYWTRGPKELPTEGVYYIACKTERVRRHWHMSYGPLQLVVADMSKPNGIIGTPDGKTLYVSDIGAGQTFVYDIQPDGQLTGKRLFCAMGSDGMTIDSAGDIYLTGRGVTIFDSEGIEIGHLDIPQPWTGNICFGGLGAHTLFITASANVYTLEMAVHGVGSQ
jgi:gluconolactonase